MTTPCAPPAPDRLGRPTTEPGRLLVVSRDAFGSRLGMALRQQGFDVDPVVELGSSGVPALPADTRAVVVAGQRPDPDLADELAHRAWQRPVPFLPVSIEQPHLVVGPYVVPGRSACLRCYSRRVRQHDPAAESSARLSAAYAADVSLRPDGWLPALAHLAAGIVAATIAGAPAALRPGDVRMLDVLTLIPSGGAVVGYTGCPTCDSFPTADRSWAALADAWPRLLGGGR